MHRAIFIATGIVEEDWSLADGALRLSRSLGHPVELLALPVASGGATLTAPAELLADAGSRFSRLIARSGVDPAEFLRAEASRTSTVTEAATEQPGEAAVPQREYKTPNALTWWTAGVTMGNTAVGSAMADSRV